mgnify:CR=1 FL=1
MRIVKRKKLPYLSLNPTPWLTSINDDYSICNIMQRLIRNDARHDIDVYKIYVELLDAVTSQYSHVNFRILTFAVIPDINQAEGKIECK